MTIKQAVAWLCQPGIVSMIHDPTTKKALNVAVKALAKKTEADNNDLVSRQEVIDTLDNYFEIFKKTGDKWAWIQCRGKLYNLPSAQPKRGDSDE